MALSFVVFLEQHHISHSAAAFEMYTSQVWEGGVVHVFQDTVHAQEHGLGSWPF
jgi:hypothetical protein